MSRSSLSALLITFAAASGAAAQNTSGVSGPEVKAGETEIGYRAAYAIDDASPDIFGQRFHIQHGFDDRWRLRVIALQSDRGGELGFRSVQLETLMQFFESEKHGGWDSALRADGTIPTEDGRPGRARIGWLNSFEVAKRWQVRADLFVAREFGNLAANDLMLEARAEATYKLPSGIRVGAQTFNTARTADISEQRRQLGFVVKGHLTKRLSYETGALFGLSRDAPDADLRLFFAYAF